MKLRKSISRSKHGVVELSALLPLFSVVIVGTVAFIVALGTLLNYQMKLALLAQTGAQVYINTYQWEGSIRPGITTDKVNATVQTAVQTCANEMGIGAVTATPSLSVNPNRDGVSYITVSVKADRLTFLSFGGLIPGTVSNCIQTVKFPYGNVSPPALGYLCAGNVPPNPDLDGAGGVLAPAYGGGTTPNYNPIAILNALNPYLPFEQQYEFYASDGGYRPI